MLCSGCGEEFAPEPGRPASGRGLCPDCADPIHSQDLFPTRSLTDSEKAAFIFPERFEPKLVLGEGAFGIVTKCWDLTLRRFVAIKRPKHHSVNQELFLREARAASQLSHPNIVRIFDVGEYQKTAYIVSEFIDGHTLRHWLHKNQPSFDVICEKCGIIADAIASAHDNDVIHRDLKPGNIMMDTTGQPRIVDFGLSHSRNSGIDTLLVEGRPIGTPAYMAPEQVRGQSDEINTWSDVYSLGTVLYQMLTGRLPFSGNSREVLDAIISDPPPPPRSVNNQIPVPLEAICLKAIAKKHEDRYQTCRELAMELRHYQNGRKLVAYPGMYPRRAKTVFRRNFMAGTAGVCGLLLTGGIYWGWKDWQNRNPRIPVMIESSPPEALLSWLPFNFETGEFSVSRMSRSIAGSLTRLAPGFYKVLVTAGSEYFEVFRTVPQSALKASGEVANFFNVEIEYPHRWSGNIDEVVQLKTVKIVPVSSVRDGMVWYGSGVVRFPDNPDMNYVLRGVTRNLGSFLIDTDEITFQDMKDVFPKLELPEGFEPTSAVTGVWMDIVLTYCELSGTNLPTVYELQLVATNGGKTRYPWGDEKAKDMLEDDTGPKETGWDCNQSVPPIVNLYGGNSEWTETPFIEFSFDMENFKPVVPSDSLAFSSIHQGSMFPENWLTVSGDANPWIDGDSGFTPCSAKYSNPNLGFRTVRRLNDVVE